MKSAWKWTAFIAGTSPSFATVLTGFGTASDLKAPFGLLAAICGIVAVGLNLVLDSVLKGRPPWIRGTLIATLAVLSIGAFTTYWVLMDRCVVRLPGRSEVFFPLVLHGSAAERIELVGGRQAYEDKYGAKAVAELLESQTSELLWTKTQLAMLFCAGSLFLPVAMSLIGGQAAARRSKRKTGIDRQGKLAN